MQNANLTFPDRQSVGLFLQSLPVCVRIIYRTECVRMIERHGYHVCNNCGEEIAWTVFIRKEYVEQEKMMTAKCLCCGTEQKWIQKIEEEVA